MSSLSLFDEPTVSAGSEKTSRTSRGEVLPFAGGVLPNAPIPSVLAPPDGYVPASTFDALGNAAMGRFAQAVFAAGYRDRILTGVRVDASKCCRAANAVLGKVVSDRPQPTPEEWRIATERIRETIALAEQELGGSLESATKNEGPFSISVEIPVLHALPGGDQ